MKWRRKTMTAHQKRRGPRRAQRKMWSGLPQIRGTALWACHESEACNQVVVLELRWVSFPPQVLADRHVALFAKYAHRARVEARNIEQHAPYPGVEDGCSNGVAGVRNGVRLEATGTRTKGERKWAIFLPALAGARQGRLCTCALDARRYPRVKVE